MSTENEHQTNFNENSKLNNFNKTFTRNMIIDQKEAFTLANYSCNEFLNNLNKKSFCCQEPKKPNLHQGRQKYQNKSSKKSSKEKLLRLENIEYESKNLKDINTSISNNNYNFNNNNNNNLFNLSSTNNILKVRKITPEQFSKRKSSDKSNTDLTSIGAFTPKITEINYSIHNSDSNNINELMIIKKKLKNKIVSQSNLSAKKYFLQNNNFNFAENALAKNYSQNNFNLNSTNSAAKASDRFFTPIKLKCNSVASLNDNNKNNNKSPARKSLSNSVNKLLERFDNEKKKTEMHLEKLKEKYEKELMKNFKEKPEINKNSKYYEKHSESFLNRIEEYQFISKAKKLELLEREKDRMQSILNANEKLRKKMNEEEIRKIIEEKVVKYLVKENLKQEKINNLIKIREEEKMINCTFKPTILDSSKKLAEKRKQKIKEKELLSKEIINEFNEKQKQNENENNTNKLNDEEKEEKVNLSDLSFGDEKSTSLVYLERRNNDDKASDKKDYNKNLNKKNTKNFSSIKADEKNFINNKLRRNDKSNNIKHNSLSNDSNSLRIKEKNSNVNKKLTRSSSAIGNNVIKQKKDDNNTNNTSKLYDLFNNSDLTVKESNVLKELLQKKFKLNK